MTLLPSTWAHARRFGVTENSQPVLYLMWGRRRNGLTDNFTLAVYMQFLVAADTQVALPKSGGSPLLTRLQNRT